ncbi:MAG: hypothetical protein EOP50_21900 [Sphingobacteriales bacterium]|nr:MAG: hypothetical protein EOP50_21900 [Sphingobacteriales bacterium]
MAERMKRIKTAIVGASGYTGMELLRLLLTHPSVELVALGCRGILPEPDTKIGCILNYML